ncbi:MAG: hypothetical protein ACRDTR_06200 [Rubrobacter sp.]
MRSLNHRLSKIDQRPEHDRVTFTTALERLGEEDLDLLAGHAERMLAADLGEPVEATQEEVGAWERLQGLCWQAGAKRN